MLDLGRVYPIVNLAESESLPEEYCKALLSSSRITLIQLRAKYHSEDSLLSEATRLLSLRNDLNPNVKIIVNDSIEVCSRCGADGVHLGQTDTKPLIARKEIGSSKIIGISTHNIKQALTTNNLASTLNYVAFGPIFRTSSKNNPEPETGTDDLEKIKCEVKLPLVAIGGINAENAPKGLCVAVINDLRVAPNPAARIEEYY